MPAPLRVIFMGTPDFAVPSLKALARRPDVARVIGVYTQPDRPAGRGQKVAPTPVKAVAEELKIPVFQPENVNDPGEKRKLADQMADIVVVVAYAQFLSNAILNTPRLGCVNVHSSLLPKFRGAAPIQYAIWKGEKETGVSTMKLVSKMDAGPVLLQKKIDVTPEMTASRLHDALAELGAGLLLETLELVREGKHTEQEQDEALVSYAPMIKKEDGLLKWERPGEELINQIRAFDPWPGTYGRSTRGTLKIHKAKFHSSVIGAPVGAQPGETFVGVGGLWVRCGDGWLEIIELQPEGRKLMQVQEFLNGTRGSTIAFESK